MLLYRFSSSKVSIEKDFISYCNKTISTMIMKNAHFCKQLLSKSLLFMKYAASTKKCEGIEQGFEVKA